MCFASPSNGRRVAEGVYVRYLDYLTATYGLGDGRVTDYLEVRDGRLWFRDLDLLALAREHGTPVEVAYLPLIGERVTAMIGSFAQARAATGYRGEFVYAYASKANVAEEVVSAALAAGAHYECWSAFDVDIARLMWRTGRLSADRLVLCNGFKVPAYARNILRLRGEGFAGVLPVLDHAAELAAFSAGANRWAAPPNRLLLGIRQRIAEGVASLDDLDRVDSRFGMGFGESLALADAIAATPDLELVLYHTMFGSQIEDEAKFLASIRFAAECWARLKQRHPTLRYLDFGGGVPVAYRIGFRFDYAGFARRVLEVVREVCAGCGVEEPGIVGEFGRYTAAEHGFHIFRVIIEKPTSRPGASWYLIDGSLMVALPDIWALGQEFIILPLNGYDRECHSAWLGGLTCDSDDEYRARDNAGGGFLTLPRPDPAEPLYLGFFATGAYQEMLSGVRGAHHCLMPEAKELLVERAADGALRFRTLAPQTGAEVLRVLGYDRLS